MKVSSNKWKLDSELGEAIYGTNSVLELRQSLVSKNDFFQFPMEVEGVR